MIGSVSVVGVRPLLATQTRSARACGQSRTTPSTGLWSAVRAAIRGELNLASSLPFTRRRFILLVLARARRCRPFGPRSPVGGRVLRREALACRVFMPWRSASAVIGLDTDRYTRKHIGSGNARLYIRM